MVRNLGPRDTAGLKAVSALQTACDIQVWTPEELTTFLKNGGTWGVIWAVGDPIQGFLQARGDAAELEILSLAVAADARGRGLAGQLVEKSIQAYPKATFFLETSVHNLAAQRLFARHGFQGFGARKDYYRGPHEKEEALLLRRLPA